MFEPQLNNRTAPDRSALALSTLVGPWSALLAPSELKVALCLYHMIEQNGRHAVRLSGRQLAKAAGVSERAVEKARKSLANNRIICLETHAQGCWYSLPAEVPTPNAVSADAQISDPRNKVSATDSALATEPLTASAPEIGQAGRPAETAEPQIQQRAAVIAISDQPPAGATPEWVLNGSSAKNAEPATTLVTTSAESTTPLAGGTGSAEIAQPDTPPSTMDTAIRAEAIAKESDAQHGTANLAEPGRSPVAASANNAEAAVPAASARQTAVGAADPTTSEVASGSANSAAPAPAPPVTPAVEVLEAPPATIEDQLAAALQKLIPGKPSAEDIRRLQQLVPDIDLLLQCMGWMRKTGKSYTLTDLALSAIEFNCRQPESVFGSPFLNANPRLRRRR